MGKLKKEYMRELMNLHSFSYDSILKSNFEKVVFYVREGQLYTARFLFLSQYNLFT